MQGALVGAADEPGLDAPMLIAEVNLQMEDLLAMALEAETARLDHTGMNRTDRHFVHFGTLHLKVIGHARQDGFPDAARPGIVPGAVRTVVPQRFQLGRPLWNESPLFGDFAFEVVRLRTIGRDGRITVSAHIGG